jgi:tetratricopeptide (TPR) repeat protein
MITRTALVALMLGSSFVPLAANAASTIDWDKRLEKASHQLAIGEVDKAIAMFSEEVKKHPEAGPPHVGLGQALKKKGRLSDAKSEFKRATEVDPGCAEAFYALGSMQENDSDWQAAAGSFEQYLQLAPGADNAKSAAERLRNCKEKME